MSNNPKNSKQAGCVSVSSNCVVWQGPDLCCINLCTGDTVSDVVNKLAKQLCVILDVLDPEQYDLSSLTTNPIPAGNFIDVIQFLIEEINELKNNPSGASVSAAGCPDCEISVATCFQNETSSMQLTDYVSAIGVKLCEKETQIVTLTNGLNQALQRITQLEEQVNLLIGG